MGRSGWGPCRLFCSATVEPCSLAGCLETSLHFLRFSLVDRFCRDPPRSPQPQQFSSIGLLIELHVLGGGGPRLNFTGTLSKGRLRVCREGTRGASSRDLRAHPR